MVGGAEVDGDLARAPRSRGSDEIVGRAGLCEPAINGVGEYSPSEEATGATPAAGPLEHSSDSVPRSICFCGGLRLGRPLDGEARGRDSPRDPTTRDALPLVIRKPSRRPGFEWSQSKGFRAQAFLLSDVDRARTFVNLGVWESAEAVRHSRGSAGYQLRVSRLPSLGELGPFIQGTRRLSNSQERDHEWSSWGKSANAAEAGVDVVLSLEPGHLPDGRAVVEARTKSAFGEHVEHRGRWMGECPELSPSQPEGEVLRRDGEARDRIAAWVAEDHGATSVRAYCVQQPLIVGIAADHPVQYDQVPRARCRPPRPRCRGGGGRPGLRVLPPE